MAEVCEHYATLSLEKCQQRQEEARQAVRGVADDDHPFDAASGRPVTAAAVEQRLEQRLQAVEQIVAAAGLGESSRAALARIAHRETWLVSNALQGQEYQGVTLGHLKTAFDVIICSVSMVFRRNFLGIQAMHRIKDLRGLTVRNPG